MYAVIDTETTGLSPNSDRIIELAVIGVDPNGKKEWEWCSLLNPERDTGSGLAIQKHQIYPKDVEGAPLFADLAGDLFAMLDGRALVAHNARFDLQMLGGELERLGHQMPDVAHICTMTIAKRAGFRPYRLDACCEALSIDLDGLHHALADARATRRLAHRLIDFSDPDLRKNVEAHLRSSSSWPRLTRKRINPVSRRISPVRSARRSLDAGQYQTKRAAQRVTVNSEPVPQIETFFVDEESSEAQYLAAVEKALEDREVSDEERHLLQNLRGELGLEPEAVRRLHVTFMQGLAGSMWSDSIISNHEQFDLDLVGELLEVSSSDVEYARDNPIGLGLISDEYQLKQGDRIVFTGEMSIPRSEWKNRATRAGLKVTNSVSGKTDYLVVPFGATGSSKSRKAGKLGVRVISEQRFCRIFNQYEESK